MTLWRRLGYLWPWRRRAAERDMQEELLSIAALAKAGELGNLTRAAEDARAEWGWPWLEQVGRDVWYAVRALRQHPAFAATTVVSLAIGIGATTAIFSLVNAFLLQSLPVRNPNRLVLLRTTEGPGGALSRAGENAGFPDPVTGRFSSTSFSLLVFDRLRAEPSVLANVFAFAPFWQVNVLVEGQPDTDASAEYVSGDYYRGLGVAAVIGRTLAPEDDRPSAAPVAVISFSYWERRFGRAPDVLGTIVEINRVPTAIVGVTPKGFDGTMQAGESPDLFVPLAHHLLFQPDRAARAQPSYWWVRIMARLQPGVTPTQAQAALQPVFQVAAREGWLATRPGNGQPDTPMPGAPTLAVDSGAQGENDVRRQFTEPLQMLMGLVGLVLAAACANVANLLLARNVARRREFALRLALGASRGRVVCQLLIESLVVAVAGASVGGALAWWGRTLLTALRPFGAGAVVLDLPIDVHVLAFTIAITVTTAFVFGLTPALHATRVDVAGECQSGVRTVGDRRHSRLNQGLMVAQIALSLVLLVSTGLFVRSLSKLRGVDVGFDRRHLVLFRIDAASADYPPGQYAALEGGIQERLARLPGVRAVTFSSVAVLSGVRQNKRISVPGHTPPGTSMIVDTNGLAPNFFDAMQLPLVLGRGFASSDNEAAPRVAVVNQSFVRTYCNGESPVGRTIRVATDDVEVVGVAGDAKYLELRSVAPATVYFPAFQRIDGTANFAVRIVDSAAGAALGPAIRAAVREIDPALPVLNLRTQDEQIDELNAQPLLFARLSGLFGLVALALAAVGLYGLTSYVVARRTGEIGIRAALGAEPARVQRMILGESLSLVGVGILIGVAGAYGAGRLVAAMLFGVSPIDLVTYLAAALVLIAMALGASLLPARRASRIDPVVALRIQ